jgi:ABC-type nitrate/sulfonate/bicarbonate transport system permease component
MTVAAKRLHPAGPGVRGVAFGIAPGVAAVLVLALAWELIGRAAGAVFFPPLSAVLVRLVELVASGVILGNLATSLTNLVLGFTISLAIGLGVGMLMGGYRRIEAALDIYVNAFLTAPSLVFAPIFFTIFGLSRWSIVALIVMYSTFILIVTTLSAIRNVSPSLIEMGRSFCASDRQLFPKIILPAATPLIMAGVRLAAGRAVKGMINGEMFIAVVGLGKLMIDEGRTFDAEAVLAILLVIIFVAFAAAKAVQIVDARLTSWLPSTVRAE